MTFEVSQADRDLFAREGYMILPGVIPADYLTLLREECSYFLGYMDARMDAGLVGEGALSVRRNRYFVNSSTGTANAYMRSCLAILWRKCAKRPSEKMQCCLTSSGWSRAQSRE